MEPSEEKLTEVGTTIRSTLAARLDHDTVLHSARERFVEQVAIINRGRADLARQRAGRRLRWAIALSLATAAGAVLVAVRSPVTFQLGGAGRPGKLGEAIEAPADAPLALNFSEGSSIVVREGGRLRVLEAGTAGARVLVEAGGIDVAIVHRRVHSTQWRFELGPFRVAVTGTKFHAGWNAPTQTLAVSMREGSVVVSGGCIASPRTVMAGDSLQLSCPSPANEPQQPPPAPEPTRDEHPVEKTRAAAEVPERTGREAASSANWRALLTSGRLRDGLRAAENAGFDRVCQTASPQELLDLSDAAQLAGRVNRATEALGILRRRFPRSVDAANAAFALGRIAFETRQAYDAAVRWFATYLDEQPSGALMGDAVGRLMEARYRSGDTQGAQADAARYLRRFPGGPYARKARSILAER